MSVQRVLGLTERNGLMNLKTFENFLVERTVLRAILSIPVLGSALLLCVPASAAIVTIDTFNLPDVQQFYVISGINDDPYLNKGPAQGIGQERDLLIDVVGTPSLTSAAGTIGDD